MAHNRYDEIFPVEIDGWCYGLENYPGEIYPGLVFRVIRQLSESFRLAINSDYVFDLVEIAGKFSKASKYLVSERDITLKIISYLPNPNTLGEDGLYTLAQILDRVEQTHSGCIDRFQRRWITRRAA